MRKALLAVALGITFAGLLWSTNVFSSGHEGSQTGKVPVDPISPLVGSAKESADPHAALNIKKAVAVIHPTAGNSAKGTVWFMQEGSKVKIVADVEGLTPGAKHAIHVHQYGDCSSPDGKSAGGHYNPAGHKHGKPGKGERHAGDLGNLTADDKGKAHYELTVDNISIIGSTNPILGRGLIVHAGEDKFVQPTGGAGARIGCGVIGVANPGK